MPAALAPASCTLRGKRVDGSDGRWPAAGGPPKDTLADLAGTDVATQERIERSPFVGLSTLFMTHRCRQHYSAAAVVWRSCAAVH
jgi:hypothetical protein